MGRTIAVSALLAGVAAWPIVLAQSTTTTLTALPLLVASQALIGFANLVFNVTQVSLRQSITPAEFQGRVNATMRFLVWSTAPIGALIGGALGEYLGLRFAILIGALGGTFSFLWVVLSPLFATKHLEVTPE
jgi:MFS family permease